jgi:hypothetical protein
MTGVKKASDPYDGLLPPQKGQGVLKKINPRAKFDPGNCPAVAAAVHDYLNGKGVRPVRLQILKGDYLLSGPNGKLQSLTKIIAHLQKAGHGHNVVVEAKAGDRVHFANLANIRSKVYYIDAYTSRPVVTPKVSDYLRWAKSLRVYPSFRVTFKPK